MRSVSEIVLEIICPTAGCILANVMFAAPVRDAHQAWQKGYLGDLNPLPWVFMMGNCYGWVFYSFLIRNYYLFFADAPGLVISVWLNLQAVKLRYLAHHETLLQQSLDHSLLLIRDEDSRVALLSETRKEPSDDSPPPSTHPHSTTTASSTTTTTTTTVTTSTSSANSWLTLTEKKQQKPPPVEHDAWFIGMILSWLVVTSVVAFGEATLEERTRLRIVGTSVNINLVFFLAAPLSTIWKVLQSRSSASIHVPTMLTNTACSVFWAAYGVAIQDWFMTVPNTVGVFLGVVQMFLRILFPVTLPPVSVVLQDHHSITTNEALDTKATGTITGLYEDVVQSTEPATTKRE